MHLHSHTWYSFLSGTLSVQRALDYAGRNRCAFHAITDVNNVTGVTEFVTEAAKCGIKPVVGAELRTPRTRAVALARDNEGYHNLCELVTGIARHYPPARVREESEKPRGGDGPDGTADSGSAYSLADALCEKADGHLIVLSTDTALLDRLARETHGAGLYVELLKHQEGRWMQLLEFSRRSCVPAVAAADVAFGEPGGLRLHRMLRTIATNSTAGTLDPAESASPSQYFASPDEMRSWFAVVPEALANIDTIASSCNVDFDFKTSKFASYEPASGTDTFQLLRNLAWEGFLRRYSRPTRRHHARLEKELDIIRRLGFIDYYLVAWDIVQYARHHNFPYVGRGSGANSIVAYCLEITNVDPIELNLFFERFLNPDRRSPPDFDIDFSWRNRDQVIDYALKKYGEERTAMIGTISTFSPRGAIHETGKALGFGESEIKKWTTFIPSFGSVKDLYDPKGQFQRMMGEDMRLPHAREWMQYALRMLDFPNHYGIHSGGVILAPDKLTRYTATQIAPKGVRITQQDMHSMDDWHLEKLDILSTRGLGTFEDTCRMVYERTGVFPPIINYRNACEDEETRRIMREGETVGCFYVESPAMIQLLKKLRTDTFEMLTAASSIIRPGVAQSGMMQAFIERFHDRSKIRPPHPRMLRLLEDTFGVMVYQEDVIKVAHFIAGLSLGEADLLRRAMSGKMRSHEAMRVLKDSFSLGCRQRGIDDAAADEIWRQIESFAGYSFCKAHSASYAVLSFQEAFLKAHYPAYFLCSVLNNQGGYYRPEVYIQEAKRLGLTLLLPDVNRSMLLHTCPDERTIQLGFLHVKDLTDRSIDAILASRERDGQFRDFEDFLHRSGVGMDDAGILIRCGACGCFDTHRAQLLLRARLLFKGRKGRIPSDELPFDAPRFEADLKHLRRYTPEQVSRIEMETFSFTVSRHVLDAYADRLKGAVRAIDLKRYVGRRVVVGGWMIAAKVSRTKKGERMMFLNLDDASGTIAVVCFPKCFDRCGHLLRTAGPFRVTGRVAEEYGVVNVVAEDVEMA
jgi:DNA polymerase-3 subunit alpha